jgi:hypothetical protein
MLYLQSAVIIEDAQEAEIPMSTIKVGVVNRQ